ncbi:MAG: hypothetical protein ABW078_16875, partial [Sedimenticola sp.]
LWSVREATYATAAYPLTNSVELHLEIEFASFIAWAGFKLGAKRYCKAYERKAVILGGLYVWCMAYVAFKFLRLFPGIKIVAVASPFLIVAALSFLAGKQGGFGRRYANERQS